MSHDQDPSVVAAMQILMGSGEARKLLADAIAAVSAFDFDTATQRLEAAQARLREAHQVHTDVIQGEAGGATVGYPALFSHAQDTMMTTDSEIFLVRKLTSVVRAVDDRLRRLEHGAAEDDGVVAAAPTTQEVSL